MPLYLQDTDRLLNIQPILSDWVVCYRPSIPWVVARTWGKENEFESD